MIKVYQFDLNLISYEKLASLIAIGGYILLYISAQQAEETIQQQQLAAGTTTGSLTPNKLITSGSWTAVIGFILVAIGSQQRAGETGAQITIL